MFVAALIAYSLTLQSWFNDQISLIDYKNGSLPPLQVPNPTSSDCSVSEFMTSFHGSEILLRLFQILGIGIVMGPLISFLESIAIAKAFGKLVGICRTAI